MSRQCQVTGKKLMFGNNVSHANNKTRRRFMPNIQDTSLYSEVLNRMISVRVSVAGLRTVDHKGGFDAFLLDMPNAKLDVDLRPIKALVEKTIAAKKTA